MLAVATVRGCQYKKIQLCLLPQYNSNDGEAYLQQFHNMVQEVLGASNDITLQLAYTSDNMNGIPNQTLMAIFVRYLSVHATKPAKISVISGETKLLNMVRYEVTKLDNYSVSLMNSEYKF